MRLGAWVPSALFGGLGAAPGNRIDEDLRDNDAGPIGE